MQSLASRAIEKHLGLENKIQSKHLGFRGRIAAVHYLVVAVQILKFSVFTFKLHERARAEVRLARLDVHCAPVDSYGARPLLIFWALCFMAAHTRNRPKDTQTVDQLFGCKHGN